MSDYNCIKADLRNFVAKEAAGPTNVGLGMRRTKPFGEAKSFPRNFEGNHIALRWGGFI